MKYINNRLFVSVLFGAFLWIYIGRATGQAKVDMTLKHGDVVPDVPLVLHRGGSVFSGSVHQFKGKLILLDFWHVSCKSCIHRLPLMWSLQKEFSGKLQVILVTNNNDRTVTEFWEKYRGAHRNEVLVAKDSLLSITSDTVLLRLFDERSFPGNGWIDSGLHIMFLTNDATTTGLNIRRMLNGDSVDMFVESRRHLDFDDPISWLAPRSPNENMPLFYSFLTGWINNKELGRGITLIKDSISKKVIGVSGPNMTMIDLFRFALNCHGLNERLNNVVLEIKDTSGLFMPFHYDEYYPWVKNHTYCYGLKVDEKDGGNVYKMMLADLERYFGYHACIEKRTAKCYLLVRAKNFKEAQNMHAGEKPDVINEEGYCYVKASMDYLLHVVADLVAITGDRAPVINETCFDGTAECLLPSYAYTGGLCVAKIREFLNRYGFDLIEGFRPMQMMVLKEGQ